MNTLSRMDMDGPWILALEIANYSGSKLNVQLTNVHHGLPLCAWPFQNVLFKLGTSPNIATGCWIPKIRPMGPWKIPWVQLGSSQMGLNKTSSKPSQHSSSEIQPHFLGPCCLHGRRFMHPNYAKKINERKAMKNSHLRIFSRGCIQTTVSALWQSYALDIEWQPSSTSERKDPCCNFCKRGKASVKQVFLQSHCADQFRKTILLWQNSQSLLQPLLAVRKNAWTFGNQSYHSPRGQRFLQNLRLDHKILIYAAPKDR